MVVLQENALTMREEALQAILCGEDEFFSQVRRLSLYVGPCFCPLIHDFKFVASSQENPGIGYFPEYVTMGYDLIS
jgi:hypothetical protein